MTERPGAVLDELRSLRDRTRADRHGYAFPLFLFGGLILLAPLLYTPAPPPPLLPNGQPLPVYRYTPFPQFIPLFGDVEHPGLIGWYWVLTIVGGMAVTGWWYRRRAQRFGVETDTRIPFVAAGAVLAGILLWQPVLDDFAEHVGRRINLYSAPWLNLPILFSSAVLATAVLTWTFRPHRTERLRLAGVFVGVLLASLTFATVETYMIKGHAALLAIAAALLTLAWLERSVLLAVVGTIFTATAIMANHWLWSWDIADLYQPIHWHADFYDTQTYAAQSLLPPGLVLLIGGVITALTSHPHRHE